MGLITTPVPNSVGINAARGGLDKAPPPAVRLSLISDYDEDTYWRSNRLNNGEFDYWLVVHVQDVTDYHDMPFNYIGTVMVVAPSQVSASTRDHYLSSLGLEDDPDSMKPADLAMLLAETGCGACVMQITGRNRARITRAAKQECQAIEMLFGFYLDRPVNRIGTTGWDMLQGNLLAGLNR